MAQGSTIEGRRRGLSRRQFVKAASAGGATAGVASVAGCLGEAREQGTVVISGDSDFEGLMHAEEGETGLVDVLYEVGLDEDIDVVVRPGPDDTGSRRQQYQSALQAGRSPPDVFMMDSGWALLFILREQSLALDDLLPSGALDRVENDYLDAAVETARHPETGELHALPLFPDFGTMQYRRDLVEDAGYDTDDWATEPISWQEFAEVTADTMEQNPTVDFGFTTQAAAYEGLSCCTFNETMSSWGGAYFGDHENLFEAGGREPTVDEEPVLDAIRMMRAFMHGEDDEHALDGYPQIAPTSIVQWSEEEARGPFANGNSIMHRNWPYSIAISGVEEEMGENLGVMPIPYGVTEDGAEYEGTGGTASALGGWHLVANPNSDRIDEVVQVMEAFATDEVMLHMFEVQGWLPPDLGMLEDVTVEEAGPVARYTDAIQVIGDNAVPRPVTDLWPEQAALIFGEVHNAYRGEKSPEGAMGDLKERLERSERDVEDQ
ncbi:extracellular solute-binding protein [Natronorarus salvus]|uniref:extracellular solute-binding protein n=1 Tax=Natronorarus salvus TaxID=3117733 RepID=UPI002F264286